LWKGTKDEPIIWPSEWLETGMKRLTSRRRRFSESINQPDGLTRTSDSFPGFIPLSRICVWIALKDGKNGIPSRLILMVTEVNPENITMKKELARNLRKAIMKLEFSDREIIMLKHFRELSYDEISILLKIPKGTVMSRLYYARHKLAELLNEYV
jgi:RNA polymerase sigma factor (sigma-70 family)